MRRDFTVQTEQSIRTVRPGPVSKLPRPDIVANPSDRCSTHGAKSGAIIGSHLVLDAVLGSTAENRRTDRKIGDRNIAQKNQSSRDNCAIFLSEIFLSEILLYDGTG
jgi:hypothetical protein